MCEPAIYFEYDSYKVDTENKTNRINLNWIAEKLNRYPDRTVILTGHTDLKGTEDYNTPLSGRRAASIQEQLILLGVDPNQIKIEAKGMDDPLTTEEERQNLNRRVDVTFGHRNRSFFDACKDVWTELFVEEDEETTEEVKPEVTEPAAKIEKVKTDVKDAKADAKKDVKEIKQDTKKDVNNIKEDVKKNVNNVQQ